MATASTDVRADNQFTGQTPLSLRQSSLAARYGKRLLDLLVATTGLAALSPLFLLVALWIKLDSDGPIFFRQERVGWRGRLFYIFKFRTMVAEAERLGAQLTVGADRRITRSGQWLRRCKLDELPQLINVLKGEMTLVGPRPEVPRYVAHYSAEQRNVLAVKPGLTSPASLAFRAESELLAQQRDPEQFYLAQVLPAKISTDLAYAQRATLLSDLWVIGQTALLIFR